MGRLVNQKNFSFLISEFKNSKYNLEIDIVGTGPDKEKLLAQAKKHNVSINFLGNLNNNELLKLYQDYKFFISTSLFEETLNLVRSYGVRMCSFCIKHK